MVQGNETSLDSLSEHVKSLNTSVTEQSGEVKTGLTALENKFEVMENKFRDKFKQFENRFEINSENVGKKLERWKTSLESGLKKITDSGLGNMEQNVMKKKIHACATESSSVMEDTKQANKYAYLVAGGYGKDGKPLSSAEVFDKSSNSRIPLKPMKT